MKSRLYIGICVIVVITSLALFSRPLRVFAATTDKDLTLDDGSGDSPQLILRDETGDNTLTLQKMDAGEADIINNEGDINLKPSGSVRTYKDLILDDGSGDSPQLILRDEDDNTLTLQKMDAGEAEIINNEGDIKLIPFGSVRIETPAGTNVLTLQSAENSITEAIYCRWGVMSSFRIFTDTSNTTHLTRGTTQVISITGGTDKKWVGILRTPQANAFEVNGDASKTAAGDWLANSDRRIKRDIHDLNDGLSVISMLRPVRFRYTEDYIRNNASIDPERYYHNFIAQEFQEVFPDSVQDNGEGLLQIDAYPVRPYLVKAVQELHSLVQAQQEQIDDLMYRERDLKKENAQLRKLHKDLAKRMTALEQGTQTASTR